MAWKALRGYTCSGVNINSLDLDAFLGRLSDATKIVIFAYIGLTLMPWKALRHFKYDDMHIKWVDLVALEGSQTLQI